MRIHLDRRYGFHDRIDLFVLTLEVLILLLQVGLHLLIALVNAAFQFREATIPRAKSLFDARSRRCVFGHLSPVNEKAARRRRLLALRLYFPTGFSSIPQINF
ncbi:hypothetical protein KGP93_08025 [Burkholderia multivorans]|nr:hypothetical protein [Burkholderia multivorans]